MNLVFQYLYEYFSTTCFMVDNIESAELNLEGYQFRFSPKLTEALTVLYGSAGLGQEDIRNIGNRIHQKTKVASIRTSDGYRWPCSWMIPDPHVAVLLPERRTPTLVNCSLERKIEVFSVKDMEEEAKLTLLERIEKTMTHYIAERGCRPVLQEADFSGAGVKYKPFKQ